MVAKKFKRKLPKQYAFIFKDPKDADEFYNYINIKYRLDHQDVDWQVPLEIDGETFYMSFYETEIPNKTINLIPMALDASATSNGNDPMWEDSYSWRQDHWYLVLTISDQHSEDSLHPKHPKSQIVKNFLEHLRQEYISTQNYYDVLFKKKS